MTTLVAIGCSHTAGSKIDLKNFDSHYNRENCFASFVAKSFNFKYLNLAVPGASNQFIHRKLVEFITTYTMPSEKYFFLIGWTSADRVELRFSDSDDYHTNSTADYHDSKYFPFNMGITEKYIPDPRMQKLKKVVDVLFEKDLKNTELATLAWSAQEILKHNNHMYYMVNTATNAILENKYTKPIIEKLDTRFFWNPTLNDHTFWNMCTNKFKFKKYSSCFHHYMPAHERYAGFLIKQINKSYKIL